MSKEKTANTIEIAETEKQELSEADASNQLAQEKKEQPKENLNGPLQEEPDKAQASQSTAQEQPEKAAQSPETQSEDEESALAEDEDAPDAIPESSVIAEALQEDTFFTNFSEKEIPLLAARDAIIIPNLVVPFNVEREPSLAAVAAAQEQEGKIIIVCQKDPLVTNPTRRDLYSIGTVCQILKTLQIPGAPNKVIVQGLRRIKIVKTLQSSPFFKVRATLVDDVLIPGEELENNTQVVLSQFRQLVDLGHRVPPDLAMAIFRISDPGQLADVISFHLGISIPQRQTLLETANVNNRLHKVCILLSRELEVLRIENRIQTRAQKEMAKGHRDYLLRQHLKAIQEELGDVNLEEENSQLAEAIHNAHMPEEVEKQALKELARLQRLSPSSPDYSMMHTYLDWLLQIPWDKRTEDRLDLDEAQQILEEDHYGLEDVKDRILEFLAVRQLKSNHRGPILCLVGPPGVGKTSIGRSIARTLGRKFNRTSLGGMRDEAELRGHRRTYVGALPGRFIKSLCNAGSLNPVIMLDEIDKVGKDFRGDPASALLEALDPEQNNEFKDHYIALPVDLSATMFILTANVLDTIPPALLDRMEVIRIAGYTREEKEKIATRFLIPRKLEEHGLTTKQMSLTPDALSTIIRRYTREAGVRELERKIAKLCSKRARQIVHDHTVDQEFPPLTSQAVEDLLGVYEFSEEKPETQVPLVGSVNGLSWTQVGGRTMRIEAAIVKGHGKLKCTGKLGQVMRESAQVAITWVRGYLERQNISFELHKHDVHIHAPEGAVPKDGPSAGVALACTFLSAVTKRPVRQDLAMTGEINLEGQVTAVGGIKEKMLAAFNAGITEVLLPKENQKDISEIPEEIAQQMQFHYLERIEQAVDLALIAPKVP